MKRSKFMSGKVAVAPGGQERGTTYRGCQCGCQFTPLVTARLLFPLPRLPIPFDSFQPISTGGRQPAALLKSVERRRPLLRAINVRRRQI